MSSDGGRIFFGSRDPLVGRDTNGDYDTYEWENGTVFLISSGTGADYSLFLDNSESGGDVFFATSDELVQGDNDARFDVYDARIPRPGDNPPPSAVPCSGDVCQGPPSVAQLLGAPPSATFNGAGNIVETSIVTRKRVPAKLTNSQKLADALSGCRKHKPRHKRIVCERQARKRYPAHGATQAQQQEGQLMARYTKYAVRARRLGLAVLISALALGVVSAAASPAMADGPVWKPLSSGEPTNLVKAQSKVVELTVTATGGEIFVCQGQIRHPSLQRER